MYSSILIYEGDNDEFEYEIEFDFYAKVIPGKYLDIPERCYPDEEVHGFTIQKVLLNGIEIQPTKEQQKFFDDKVEEWVLDEGFAEYKNDYL